MNESAKVSLAVDEMPESLYDALLAEFRRQHGDGFSFTDWAITATKEGAE